jgi:surfactin synthase thioesterase subunit
MTSIDPRRETWLRRYHEAPPGRGTLVCLPHAGGSASFFFPVSNALRTAYDVLAVQYPGRQDRRAEPCLATVEELADHLAPLLLPLAEREPMTLFGHSMGATLGFEVALRLEAAGATPSALFASGRRAPSRPRDERVHERDDAGLLAEVRALSGTNTDLLGDDEVVRMILPALRADYRAAETYRYRPGPPLSCPITALVGDDDPKVTVDEAMSWCDHTTAEFAHRVFPGGHFYLIPCATEVIGVLADHATILNGQ